MTVRTESSEDDLGLVEQITGMVAGGEAGAGAHGTVDVRGAAAGATHQVVVVVPGAGLESSRRARRFDPPHEARIRAGGEHVVDRLSGNPAEPLAGEPGDELGGGAAVGIPWPGC